VTSLWCTFVNIFLVVHPTHILVHPRMHRAHRLNSAARQYGNNYKHWKILDLALDLNYFFYNPNPTHLGYLNTKPEALMITFLRVFDI